jgi:hypothetical protein
MTNLTNEQMLARDMADIVRDYVAAEVGKLRAENVAVKAEMAELRGQFRLLKELFVRDQKHAPGDAEAWNAPPWPAKPGFKGRDLKSVGH